MIRKAEPSSAAKILVVEDEQIVAMDMEMQLTTAGYQVAGIAATGKQAIRLAESTQPDLVVMDIQLQGALDGLTTASAIQQMRRLPIVFVTAFGNSEARQCAEVAGAVGFITKPYRPEDLQAAVSAALAHRKLA